MLNERPDELAGFVRALIKAEAFIKSNLRPHAGIEKASEGLLSKEVIKTKFAEPNTKSAYRMDFLIS